MGTLKLTNGMTRTTQGLEFSETSISTLAGSVACLLGGVALSPVIAYAVWTATDRLVNATSKPPWQVCYADSFANLLTLRIDWSNLLPPLDEIFDFLQDPVPVLEELLQALASITRFLEFDPSYFVENIAALNLVNVVLGLLKVVATFGNKLFAALDALHSLMFLGVRHESEADDEETVQVHECVADPTHFQKEAAIDLLCQKCGSTCSAVIQATTLNWSDKDLRARDASVVVDLMCISGSLTSVR